MRKMIVCAVMLAFMAGLTATTPSPLLAQAKKDKDTKSKKAATGTIEITEGKDGKYRFSVRNTDGKYLGGSGLVGYSTEKECKEAIEEMKEILTTGKITKGTAKEKEKAKGKKGKEKDN